MDPGFPLTQAEKILCSEIGVFGCLSVCCLVSHKSCSSRGCVNYDPASVLATVTSHRSGLPIIHRAVFRPTCSDQMAPWLPVH